VLQKPFSAHSTVLRRELHWLLIRQRIEYKIAAITYKALWSTGLLTWSSSWLPANKDSAFINRQQAAASSTHQFVRWQVFLDCSTYHLNSLSPTTRSADTIGTFKSWLKTDLFTSAYISPRTVQHYCSALDSLATRALQKFVLPLTLTLNETQRTNPNKGRSPSGLVLSWSTVGLLKERALFLLYRLSNAKFYVI